MNTQSLLLSSTFLFSQVHSFATTGVCPCLQFLMITQAPDRNSISLDVFLYNLTRAEAWIMASGNHNIVFLLHHLHHDETLQQLYIISFFIIFTFFSRQLANCFPFGWWHGSLFLSLHLDMFFPRRRCGSILGILTVSLLFGSSKRLVRSRNHRWSWSISCFGSVFGTAFSVPPV